MAYDTNVSGTVAPAAANTDTGSVQDVVGVLVTATAGTGNSGSYTYDQADRLTGAAVGSAIVGYDYNGDGVLVGRTTTAGTHRLLGLNERAAAPERRDQRLPLRARRHPYRAGGPGHRQP